MALRQAEAGQLMDMRFVVLAGVSNARRFVVDGDDLGDRGLKKGPFRRWPYHPNVEGSRGDRCDVRGEEHATDLSDPEPIAMLGDERTLLVSRRHSPARGK